MVRKIEALIRDKRGIDLSSMLLLCPRCRTQVLAGSFLEQYGLTQAGWSQLEQAGGSHDAKQGAQKSDSKTGAN
jgi:hypothetical protein